MGAVGEPYERLADFIPVIGYTCSSYA
jgi:hypothetical protein